MLRTIHICKTCRIIYACSINGVKTNCKECTIVTDNCWVETTTLPLVREDKHFCQKHLDEEQKSQEWKIERVKSLMR
jgi:hypothetical protein